MFYLANAFALAMVPDHCHLSIDRIDDWLSSDGGQYLAERDIVSIIGHQSTADFASRKLGFPVPVNRAQVKVQKGSFIYVIQLMKRLEEGQVLSEQELNDFPVGFYVVNVL